MYMSSQSMLCYFTLGPRAHYLVLGSSDADLLRGFEASLLNTSSENKLRFLACHKE
jgi:hypothetical protein